MAIQEDRKVLGYTGILLLLMFVTISLTGWNNPSDTLTNPGKIASATISLISGLYFLTWAWETDES